MSRIIFCAFVFIAIAEHMVNADLNNKEERRVEQADTNAGYDPAKYHSRYLDLIPGANDGTYTRLNDARSGQPSYVKHSESTVYGSDGRSDISTSIKIIPEDRRDTVITKTYPGGSIPIGVAKSNAPSIINPEIFALLVAFFASFNV